MLCRASSLGSRCRPLTGRRPPCSCSIPAPAAAPAALHARVGSAPRLFFALRLNTRLHFGSSVCAAGVEPPYGLGPFRLWQPSVARDFYLASRPHSLNHRGQRNGIMPPQARPSSQCLPARPKMQSLQAWGWPKRHGGAHGGAHGRAAGSDGDQIRECTADLDADTH